MSVASKKLRRSKRKAIKAAADGNGLTFAEVKAQFLAALNETETVNSEEEVK